MMLRGWGCARVCVRLCEKGTSIFKHILIKKELRLNNTNKTTSVPLCVRGLCADVYGVCTKKARLCKTTNKNKEQTNKEQANEQQ